MTAAGESMSTAQRGSKSPALGTGSLGCAPPAVTCRLRAHGQSLGLYGIWNSSSVEGPQVQLWLTGWDEGLSPERPV